MTAEIRQLLHATPFVPFAIKTSDGHVYPVPTPDHASVYPSGRRVTVYHDDDTSSAVSALHISALDKALPPPRRRGPRPPTKR